MEEEKKFAPILPFNVSEGEFFLSYDNITYVQDKDLCGEQPVKMASGNIIKYYSIKENAPISIGG